MRCGPRPAIAASNRRRTAGRQRRHARIERIEIATCGLTRFPAKVWVRAGEGHRSRAGQGYAPVSGAHYEPQGCADGNASVAAGTATVPDDGHLGGIDGRKSAGQPLLSPNGSSSGECDNRRTGNVTAVSHRHERNSAYQKVPPPTFSSRWRSGFFITTYLLSTTCIAQKSDREVRTTSRNRALASSIR